MDTVAETLDLNLVAFSFFFLDKSPGEQIAKPTVLACFAICFFKSRSSSQKYSLYADSPERKRI